MEGEKDKGQESSATGEKGVIRSLGMLGIQERKSKEKPIIKPGPFAAGGGIPDELNHLKPLHNQAVEFYNEVMRSLISDCGDCLQTTQFKGVIVNKPGMVAAVGVTESDCESCGSNSTATVCNSGSISLKRGRDKLVEKDAEKFFIHLVNPKRRSMQKSCWCCVGAANIAVLWSLRQHRLQPSPDSLPCIYRSYSFWESVANLANQNFDLNLNVKSALGLAAEMKADCVCGEAMAIFSNPIDNGPVLIPQYDELIGGDPSAFISDEVFPYLSNFVDPSSHTFNSQVNPFAEVSTSRALVTSIPNEPGPFVDPSSHTFNSQVNPIAEVSTSRALVTSIPNEPGSPTKKRKATLDELQSLFLKCPNLPRKTIYKAIKAFKCEVTLSMWMKDTLKNKLDFLEDLTPKSHMRAFIDWRETAEVLSLE